MGADGHELVKPVQVGELCPYRGKKRVKAPKPPGPYARGWQQSVKTTLKNRAGASNPHRQGCCAPMV